MADSEPVRKLLHVLPSFALGGSQKRVAALANGLGPDFRHVVLAIDGCRDATSLLAPNAALDFVEVEIEKSSGFHLGNLARLRSLLRRERPDVLITYNWGSIEAALANRLFPLCRHLHCEDGFAGADSGSPEPWRRSWLRRLVLGPNSRLVVPSRALERLAVAVWSVPEDRIHYLPNGIDVQRYRPTAGASGRRRGETVLGTVARLSPEKNLARLLEILGRLVEEGDFRLLIAGDGPERGRLEAMTAELGLTDRVAFLGQVEDVAALLAGFDIFALTSDSEQMPYSVLEAMAAGLPVIATDVGDLREMLSGANRPWLVAPEAETRFADFALRLSAMPEERRAIGAANRRRVEDHFSEELMLDRYRTLLLGEST